MWSSDDLDAAISSFIDESRAFLSVGAAEHHSRVGHRATSVSPASHAKYTVVDEMERTGAQRELFRATELLKEALREWNQERNAHNQTKQLLRLALQELKEGKVGHVGDDLHALLLASPQRDTTHHHHTQAESAAAANRVGSTDHEGSTSKALHAMLVNAAPSMYTYHSGTVDERSPISRSPPRSFASPSDEIQRRTPPSSRSHPARWRDGDSLVGSSPTFKPRCVAPPFQSSAPRFRDMVPAGDQLVYETKSGNSVGLQYKKASDVKQARRGETGLPLSSYALRARTAVEELSRRLTTAAAAAQRPTTPSRVHHGGGATLYSPR